MPKSRLIPEVQELIDSGMLPEIDGEWIQNLPKDQQLQSAHRKIYGTPVIVLPDMSSPKRLDVNKKRTVRRSRIPETPTRVLPDPEPE